MQRILLFDIDGTIFDPKTFLNLFFDVISKQFKTGSKDEFWAIFRTVRDGSDYFIPDQFLDALVSKYPQTDRENLEKIFWNIDLFRKSVYKDTLTLEILKEKALLGVFSKGDAKFQKFKLKAFDNLFSDENVYIYPNKLVHVDEVSQRYKNSEIYFIDNQADVLNSIGGANPNSKLVLIDRLEDKEDNINIIKINSLEEIQNLI